MTCVYFVLLLMIEVQSLEKKLKFHWNMSLNLHLTFGYSDI